MAHELEDTANLIGIRSSLWKGKKPFESVWEGLLDAIKKEVAIIKEADAKGESVVPRVRLSAAFVCWLADKRSDVWCRSRIRIL